MLSPAILTHIGQLDTFLLAMAMAALGLATHFRTLRRAGGAPMMLALMLFAWLVIGGAAVNHLMGTLAHAL